MAISKSDLRVIELLVNKEKDEDKRSLAETEAQDGSKTHIQFLRGRIDGYSRALNLIRVEFEEVVR